MNEPLTMSDVETVCEPYGADLPDTLEPADMVMAVYACGGMTFVQACQRIERDNLTVPNLEEMYVQYFEMACEEAIEEADTDPLAAACRVFTDNVNRVSAWLMETGTAAEVHLLVDVFEHGPDQVLNLARNTPPPQGLSKSAWDTAIGHVEAGLDELAGSLTDAVADLDDTTTPASVIFETLSVPEASYEDSFSQFDKIVGTDCFFG